MPYPRQDAGGGLPEFTRRLKYENLYEHQQDKKRKAVDQLYGDKGEIAWGHQIRSYVMQPYTMVKDHRTDVQVGNVQGVLDGNLDPFIEAYLKNSRG